LKAPVHFSDVAIDKDLIYVAYSGGGLKIFRDLGNSFKEIGQINIPDLWIYGANIIANDGYVYVDPHSGTNIIIIDGRNPKRPKIVQKIHTPYGITKIILYKNYLFFQGYGGYGDIIGVIKVSKPNFPKDYNIIYSSKNHGICDMAISNKVLYLLQEYTHKYHDGYKTHYARSEKVTAFNISNPYYPRKINSYQLSKKEKIVSYCYLLSNVSIPPFNDMLLICCPSASGSIFSRRKQTFLSLILAGSELRQINKFEGFFNYIIRIVTHKSFLCICEKNSISFVNAK
jgi:hypothetical protein